MLSVYKYPLRADDEIKVSMPAGAIPLHVEVQAGTPCLWALVDPQNTPEVRTFRMAGTGHPIDYAARRLSHVGTFTMHGGALVFHVFEVLRS